MITELKNRITENYKNMKKIVSGQNFPWYYLDKTVYGTDEDDMSMFYHCLLGRPAHEIDGEKVPALPRSASNYFQEFYYILKASEQMTPLEQHHGQPGRFRVLRFYLFS